MKEMERHFGLTTDWQTKRSLICRKKNTTIFCYNEALQENVCEKAFF